MKGFQYLLQTIDSVLVSAKCWCFPSQYNPGKVSKVEGGAFRIPKELRKKYFNLLLL